MQINSLGPRKRWLRPLNWGDPLVQVSFTVIEGNDLWYYKEGDCYKFDCIPIFTPLFAVFHLTVCAFYILAYFYLGSWWNHYHFPFTVNWDLCFQIWQGKMVPLFYWTSFLGLFSRIYSKHAYILVSLYVIQTAYLTEVFPLHGSK